MGLSVLSALARISTRYRWIVVAMWLVLLLGTLFGSRAIGGTFSNDLTLAGTDSQAAYDTLRAQFPELSGDGMQVIVHSTDAAQPVTSRPLSSGSGLICERVQRARKVPSRFIESSSPIRAAHSKLDEMRQCCLVL
jgi:uncharacterized membrane protein YdfJ with MMPL/SSD domain